MKRIISIVLVLVLMLQLCSIGASAASDPNIATSLEGFQGVVLEKGLVEGHEDVFMVTSYAYGKVGSGIHIYLTYDKDKIQLANPKSNYAVVTGMTKNNAFTGYTQYLEEAGDQVDNMDSSMGWLTYVKRDIDIAAGTLKVDIGPSTNVGMQVYYPHVVGGQWEAMTDGVGYPISCMYFKILDGTPVDQIGADVFSLLPDDDCDNPTGVAVVKGSDKTANKAFFKSFYEMASTVDLTSIAASDIAAPAVGANVPKSTAVTFGVGSGGTAPASATASIAWTKGGTAYNDTTFKDYSTAYTATYTVTIPDGYAYVNGTTAVTLGGSSAGTVSVNGKAITFTKTYTTGAESGTVAPPKPAEPGSGVTKEDPTVTTGQNAYDFTYKSTGTGTPVMGKVTLKRKDGTTFNLNAQAAGNVLYQMTASAQSGYKFTGWKKTAGTFSLMALDGNGVDTSAVTIEGTAEVLSQYTAMFAEQGAVAVGEPKLDQLTVSTTDGKSALLRTDHSKDGFASDVTDYLLYLLPGVSGFDLNMKIESSEMDTFDTVVKVGGTAVTPSNATADGIVTHTYTKNVTTTSGDVKIEVITGGKTTTYTVKASKVSAAPTIAMEVKDKAAGVYGLDVSLENTIANEFAFKLNLDNTVFTGFTKDASELANGEVTAALNAQLAADSAFEVVQATYDAASNTLTAVLATADNSYADCTAKTLVGSFEFKTESGGSVSAADWSKLTIDSDFASSTLSDQRFTAFAESDGAFDAGLIRITVPDMMTIVGYLNTLMKADVQASLAAISIKDGADQVGTATLDAARRFTGKVSSGTYTLEITLNNYAPLTVEIGADNALIGALAMTAGDLNGDGVVNTTDRTQLIGLLYSAVTAGAIGDIDGDGKVTGGDLGYLLANM